MYTESNLRSLDTRGDESISQNSITHTFMTSAKKDIFNRQSVNSNNTQAILTEVQLTL